jgi:threonine aldolase
MKEGHINLDSDTQSRPTAGMRQFMFQAEVGDEQKGLDKSVNLLCERVARMLGKESALFLPSGTMCNEIAILVHCRPGDEMYAHEKAHVIHFEAGGPSALAGVGIHALPGDRGIYTAQKLRHAIRDDSRYGPRSRLVEVEQTSNLGGGAIWSLEEILSVVEVAKSRDLRLHLDGARLLNAVVASGVPADEYAAGFDSAWIDLSKGLGCPVGAVLAGSAGFVQEAWRWKQRIGGAMRQAGFLAAAGLYALDHHVDRLAEDHENARRLGDIVSACEGVSLRPERIETNIVFIDVSETGLSAEQISRRLEGRGINIGAFSPQTLRAVTHLDVNREQIEEAGQVFLEVVAELRA